MTDRTSSQGEDASTRAADDSGRVDLGEVRALIEADLRALAHGANVPPAMPSAPTVPPSSRSAPPVTFAHEPHAPFASDGRRARVFLLGGAVALAIVAWAGARVATRGEGARLASSPARGPASPPAPRVALTPFTAPDPAPLAVVDPATLAIAPRADRTSATAPPARPASGAARGARGGARSSAGDATVPARPAPRGAAGDLGDAIRDAVGPTEAPAAANATTATSDPGSAASLVPPTGALQSALGAVLPAARACLGPDDPIARAHVVFLSSGAVGEVRVAGASASQRSAPCVTSALRRAVVAPFARPRYAVDVTVRPE